MFDFTPGAARAPTLVLDPATGNKPSDPPAMVPPVTPPGVMARPAMAFKASVKPARDRSKPFVFKLKGRLTPPAGAACTGKVSVAVRAGKKLVTTRKASLPATCAWSLGLKLTSKKRLGNGRLTLRPRYLGSAAVLARNAKALHVRAG
jgi:hypothetical protein